MSDEAIRVGIIGAGNNTRVRHIPGLKAIAGVELVSVCNRSQASSRRVAEQFGIPKVFDRWQDLLADPDINAVVIGTWPYMHRELTCAALDAGKHVMCEARMATNAAEAHVMLKKAREHPHLVAQIVPARLTFRADRTIQELMASGYLGNLYVVHVSGTNPGFATPDGPLHWRNRRELSGLNVLNMSIWYELSMRWAGPASSVSARMRTYVKERCDPETGAMVACDVPDHVEIVADLENGAVATYEFSAVTGFSPGEGVWLFGSAGTLRFDFATQKLFGGRTGDKALAEIVIPPEKAGKWRVEEEFANAIRGMEKIRLTDFATGVKYMEFTDAVHRSAASGQAVSLPLAEFQR
jgi:predicted dehydrogenase